MNHVQCRKSRRCFHGVGFFVAAALTNAPLLRDRDWAEGTERRHTCYRTIRGFATNPHQPDEACQGASSTLAGHLLLHEENNGPVKEGNATAQSAQHGDDSALGERTARKYRVRALRYAQASRTQ
ncbi:hypothetical protein FPL06_04150 [Xanthomonas citri pv. glycines]|nr:hypothetical protein BHE84_24795 [Xanthomonas citri pv. glycines str. 8ra]KAB0538620.1 hypothetical protein F7R02_05135 [Xanthomonas cissicola]QDR47009.1 hypothetical protein FPK90_22125 [Xanthomonas citri pv. glycines]QDS08994.1 hypothetical protein FPL00_20940 [Xanthomonas citri pv. glycines]QDS13397.1 hypothetical protein FPL03_21650 [Xanthomonas citri pv. glycines]